MVDDGGRSPRRQRVIEAVEDGVERWRRRYRTPFRDDLQVGDLEGRDTPDLNDSARRRTSSRDAQVLQPLPRRQPLLTLTSRGEPALREDVRFEASLLFTLTRLLRWLYAVWLFVAGWLIDRLRGRDSQQRRAERLRRTFESLGGTFLKLGQQLSIRIDMLPMTYCMELTKLLDHVPPFPASQAIESFERASGRTLADCFRAFDPEPIGSASVACVYQAELHDGQRVAVKIRRPGIVRSFAADWRALTWMLTVAEVLTLIRPGQWRSMVRDLGAMFREELDFRREARNTYLFRRGAQKSRLKSISAPRVYFEWSSAEVLVTEFVSGVWLWELLGAVESGDRETLARIRQLGIEPETVAKRLLRASLFGIFENLIFHADPHPANVVVRPDSEIVLIDFGSCGSYTQRQLHIMRQFHYCQSQEDVGGMVQCALALMEPLPPVDIDAMTRDMEEVFGNSIQALHGGGAEWWERTSAGVWMGFMRLAPKYYLQVNLDTLRMIRSTLLYDTIAGRLYPDLDIYREYRRYRKEMARSAHRRFRRRWRRLWSRGIDERIFLRGEELLDLGERLAYKMQRFADSPAYKFSSLAGKAVFAASTMTRWGILGLVLAGGATAIRVLGQRGDGEPIDFGAALVEIGAHPVYLGVMLVLLIINLRRILFRFGDADS